MSKLDFEFHRKRLSGDAAIFRHVKFVHGALAHALLQANAAADEVDTSDAKNYMRHGVGRRCLLLREAFTSIQNIAPPDRKEPLSNQEANDITRDLNTVYINVCGVADNLAWCVLYEKCQQSTQDVVASSAGLFTKVFRSYEELSDLHPRIERYKAWFGEIQSLRHPAAHKIPLYVPPAMLDENAQSRFSEISRLIGEATQNQKFERVDALFDEQAKLGFFLPIFAHDFSARRYPIYPTVPNDIGNLVCLMNDVFDFLGLKSATENFWLRNSSVGEEKSG